MAIKTSYEDLQKKVRELETELEEIKSEKSNSNNDSNNIFYKICEHSKNAIALFVTPNNGRSFNIKYFNKKAIEIENINYNLVVGQDIEIVFPTIRESGFLKTLQSVYKTNSPEEFPYVLFSSKKIAQWKHNYIYKLSENELVCIYFDITKEKIKDSELKEHQDKLQLAMKAASYFAFEVDFPKKEINAVSELYRSLGYSEKEIVELMRSSGSLIDKDDFQKSEDIISKITPNTDTSFNSEIRIKNKKDKWLWFKLSGKIVEFSSNNEPIRILGLIKNIQEEKEIQIKLTESENRLKLTMESANQALIDWNIKEDNIYFSPEWFTMLGYNPKDQIINYDFTVKISHPDDVPSAILKLESHIKGETELFDSEVRMKTKSGKWKWILTHGKIVERDSNGSPLRALGIQTDISNIKIAEQKRIESEANFRQLSENINDAFWLRSIDNKVIYANPACYKIVGDNLNEIFEDFEVYRNWIHPEDREFITQLRKKNLKNPDKVHFYEHRIIQANGKIKWLWIRTFPVYNQKGELYRRAGIASDVTEQKKLLADLLNAKEKAEESDQLKSAFLANMSHEIRTPMNGILGFAELLKDRDITEEEKGNYLKIIDSNGTQLLTLINDIIDVSKIEVGQLSFHKTNSEIRPVLNEIHYFFIQEQKRFKNQNVRLELHVPQNLNDIIYTDISRLQQVLNNLISNAIKFTEKGIIKLGYDIVRIDNKPYFQFYVSDTGIGISESMKAFIFERFGQIQQQKYSNQHGTGLGLAISKGLIDLLGGKIWCESTPGEGSTFYFTIPFSNSDTTKNYNSDFNKNAMNTNWKNVEILIVEDDEDNLEFLKRLLIKQGANVVLARTGEEAVRHVANNDKIKLVLMDIRLPDIDGFEATQKIKAFKPDLPIIAQTAYAMYNDREICLQNGCDDYISKPLDKNILFEKINSYIYP
ncbi:MAG: PAS domain-containing protein [Bacteroidales bacterium]|nr:PAS domain-containing protein [Bacteroidales bacterium]